MSRPGEFLPCEWVYGSYKRDYAEYLVPWPLYSRPCKKTLILLNEGDGLRCHCGSREQSSSASQISSCSDLGPPMLQKRKKNHFCPKQNILPRVLCHGNTNRIRQQDITFHSYPVQLLNLGWQMMWKHKRKSKLLSKALLYVTKTGWQRVLLIAHSGTQFASFMFTWASKDLK